MDSIVWEAYESVVKTYMCTANTLMYDAMTKREFLKWNYRYNTACIVLEEFLPVARWPVAKDGDDLLYLLSIYEERFKQYSLSVPYELRPMHRESYMAIREIKSYFMDFLEEYNNG